MTMMGDGVSMGSRRRAGLVGLALLVGAGCNGRPVPGSGNDAGIDANAPSCDLGGTVDFSLCGTIGAKAVAYVPPYGVQTLARGVSQVSYEVYGLDEVWLDLWGDMQPWKDSDPRDVSGWLLRPPASWAGDEAWICGQSGTITHNADDSIDATLTMPAVLPHCSEGGSASLHDDAFGGIAPFASGGACSIGYTIGGTHTFILTASCPQIGIPLALDGARIVIGPNLDTTACVGSGATLMLLPDTSANGAHHVIVDIPSMSTPEPCDASPPVEGELKMKVAGFHGG
jgi:hypothetical protein